MTGELEKLSAAKLWLISSPAAPGSAEQPRGLSYLSQALYALVPVLSATVPTMRCDALWRIYVNPHWLTEATVPVIGRELAHALWHLLGDHAGRARSLGIDRATQQPWKLATDLTIGEVLHGEQLRTPELPVPWEHGHAPGLSAEEYFAVEEVIPRAAAAAPDAGDDGEDDCGSAADGIPRAEDLPADADAGSIGRFDAEAIRQYVAIEFQEHCRSRGDVPLGAARWINGVLQPTTPWEPVLAAAVRRAVGWAAGRGEFTYSRPSRRSGSTPGVILPGQRRPVPRVSIVLDTSGSVDDHLLSRALGEVEGVVAALGVAGSSVTVYSVDAEAVASERVRRASDVQLVGGGGTDMRIGIAAALLERPRPDVIIVLTDGLTPWPRTPPLGTVVIAALIGRRDGPAFPQTPDWMLRVECAMGG